jgi:sugar lactone lactonase YvrE
MGTQSTSPLLRTTRHLRRIALLLALASPYIVFAQTSALTVPLLLPSAIVFDAAGNLYFAETAKHVIRKVDTSGHITTIAGTTIQGFSGDNGPATAATLDSPQGLALDSTGNLYLADTHNHRIRRIDATTQIITTIAGTGASGYSGDTTAAIAATLALPHGLTIDLNGNLYLADTANHRIRRIDAATGIITTIAGDGTQTFAGDNAPAITASLDSPRSTALSPTTLLTLADTNNQRIRQLTAGPAPATTIQTIAGIGVTTPGALTLTAPSVIAYGTGQLTATLASATPATGLVTFFDANSTLGTASLTSNTATLSTGSLPVGTHSITATYAGDPTHLGAQTSTFSLTIAPQQLTANLAPITLLYGQTLPSITATLSGVLPQDTNNVTAAFTTPATTLSPAGNYPITATLTGPAAGNYALAPISATITINPAPTVVTLTDNLIANPTTGSPVTFTATVTSSTAPNPIGSITLLDNGAPISTQPLTSGAAVFSISSITQGVHSFTALYTGGTNFASSTSTPQLITITSGGPAPDFTLAPTGTTSQTILSGSSATFNFTTAFQGDLSSPITLAATGLPNLATASFNPPTIPPGAATNTFTLTIATPNTTAQNTTPKSWTITCAFLLAALALHKRERIAKKILALGLLSFTLVLTDGCGDRINAADALALSAKPYTITVTGTATTATGSILQHTVTVTLLLEQSQ